MNVREGCTERPGGTSPRDLRRAWVEAWIRVQRERMLAPSRPAGFERVGTIAQRVMRDLPPRMGTAA